MWWRRVLRTLIAGVLILFILLGVRSLWVPVGAAPTVAADPRLSYPVGEAQAVAARWASAYLAWQPGEDAVARRQAALALDAPSVEGAQNTWDGQGTQSVLSVLPGRVQVTDDGKAGTVTVLAQVKSGRSAATWITLGVPTAIAGERVVVTGTGAFTALSTPSVPSLPPPPSVDSAVGSATEATARAFFAVYAGASQEQVAQITAPGSSVAPLGGGATFNQLVEWRVYAGDATERRARAVVEWGTSAGGRVRQAYELRLVSVAGAGATSWRVASIAPATS